MSLDSRVGICSSSEYFADLIIIYVGILKNIDPVIEELHKAMWGEMTGKDF